MSAYVEDWLELVDRHVIAETPWIVNVTIGTTQWPAGADSTYTWQIVVSWKAGATDNPNDPTLLQRVLVGQDSGAWADFRAVPVSTDPVHYAFATDNSASPQYDILPFEGRYHDVAGNPGSRPGVGYQLYKALPPPEPGFPTIPNFTFAMLCGWRTGAITPDDPPGAVDYWKTTLEPADPVPGFIDGEGILLQDEPPAP